MTLHNPNLDLDPLFVIGGVLYEHGRTTSACESCDVLISNERCLVADAQVNHQTLGLTPDEQRRNRRDPDGNCRFSCSLFNFKRLGRKPSLEDFDKAAKKLSDLYPERVDQAYAVLKRAFKAAGLPYRPGVAPAAPW